MAKAKGLSGWKVAHDAYHTAHVRNLGIPGLT